MEARTSSSLSPSQKITRSGCKPAWAMAGKNRSGLVRHQRTLPFERAAMPAANNAAAAPSTVPAPPPAISRRAPYESPPPGRCSSISRTPKGSTMAFRFHIYDLAVAGLNCSVVRTARCLPICNMAILARTRTIAAISSMPTFSPAAQPISNATFGVI